MKIAFLCKSLERGGDGVGDYTRRLAGELIRQGRPCVLIGLNDSYVLETRFETQNIEGATISVLRLPENLSWNQRVESCEKWLGPFAPDWISLQFVPFAFHPKGIIKEFAAAFSPIIRQRKLHLMFHELWILWQFPLSFRKRLLGQLQKFHIRKFLNEFRPDVVTTQLPIYQNELSSLGVEAVISPLHGNIPVVASTDSETWLKTRVPELLDSQKVIAGFFGNLLPTLDIKKTSVQLSNLKIPKEKLQILIAGKLGEDSQKNWGLLKNELQTLGAFDKLGELTEPEASSYFSNLDYGLTSYPPELMMKSGSVAAMIEHGLPVLPCGILEQSDPILDANDISTKVWTVKDSAHLLLKQTGTAKIR